MTKFLKLAIARKVMGTATFLTVLLTLIACVQPKAESMIPTPEPSRAALTPDSRLGTTQPGSEGTNAREEVIVIQGAFDPAGEELLALEPIRRYAWAWEESATEAEGYFVVEVTYVNGDTTSVKFDALIANDAESATIQHGFFAVYVPVKGEIAAVKIMNGAKDKTFALIDGEEIPLSASTPP